MHNPIKISGELSRLSLLIYPARKDSSGGTIRGAQATGFLWLHNDDYFLVTNWHNVTGWDLGRSRAIMDNAFTPEHLEFRLLILKEKKEVGGLWEAKNLILELFESDGTPIWYEHPVFGPRVDVVAIRIGGRGDWTIMSQPVNTSKELVDFEVVVGDDAFVLGFPLGLHGGAKFPIWKRASVASEPEIDLDNLPKILIDTATRRGMSGSPVIAVRRGIINPRGVAGLVDDTIIGTAETFLGVYSGRVDDDPLGAQLGIVWKASVVGDIISGGVRGTTPFDAPQLLPVQNDSSQ